MDNFVRGFLILQEEDDRRNEAMRQNNLLMLTKLKNIIKESSCEKKKIPKKKKKYWVRPYYQERDESGCYNNIFESLNKLKDKELFNTYMRMSSTQLEELLLLVGPLIKKEEIVRVPISVNIRLVLTLRYLATGESQRSLSLSYKVSPTAVHFIIRETTQAIVSVLKNKVFPKINGDTFKTIAEGFEKQWNFPNCIGAIDGKHVTIQAPENAGSDYFNYKKAHSLVLLAIADHNYSFLMCDVGASGRQSDGGIFRNSEFGQRYYNNSLPIPPPSDVCPEFKEVPYVFVADDAFALTKNMLKPIIKCNMTIQQRIFNYRLSRARRIIENSFGILCTKWRIFRTPIIAKLETVENIIMACACLHNWLRQQKCRTYFNPGLVDMENSESVTMGSWRSEPNHFQPLQPKNVNSTNAAKEIRIRFAEYFEDKGAVPWQLDRI